MFEVSAEEIRQEKLKASFKRLASVFISIAIEDLQEQENNFSENELTPQNKEVITNDI